MLTVNTQRGVALIPVLLVVAIVASTASLLTIGQMTWFRQVENLQGRADADALGELGTQATISALASEPQTPATPADLDRWAKAAPAATDGNSLRVAVVDAQSRFNLNSLMKEGSPSPADIGVFQRLLSSLKLDPQLSDAVLDWMDADSARRPNGAEDQDYLASASPYRAANRPLVSVDELRLIRGFDAATVAALEKFVTVLPVSTPVNINTAPAEVISALFALGGVNVGQRMVAARDRQPFTEPQQIVVRAGAAPASENTYSMQSSYYYVDAAAQFGASRRQTRTLVFRPPNLDPIRVLWKTYVF